MSYQAIDQLTGDPTFNGRVRACVTQQAESFKDDQRPDFVSLANDILRVGGGDPMWAFIRITAAGPGIGDKADNGDGTIDQAKVTDADLLSLVQANWQVVASLFYDTDGTPTGGT